MVERKLVNHSANENNPMGIVHGGGNERPYHGRLEEDDIRNMWNGHFDTYKYLREGDYNSLAELVEYPAVLRLANGDLSNPEAIVLDEGNAFGYFLQHIFMKGAGASPKMVVALDISEKMQRYAKEYVSDRDFASKVSFVQASQEDVPLPSNTFDLITSMHVLHYATDVRKAISETWRLLKPGGKFIFGTKHELRNRMYALATTNEYRAGGTWYPEYWTEGQSEPIYVRYYSTAEYVRMLADAGFQNVRPFELQVDELVSEANPVLYNQYRERGVPCGILFKATKPL